MTRHNETLIARLEAGLRDGWVPLSIRGNPTATRYYRDAVTQEIRAMRAENALADAQDAAPVRAALRDEESETP